MSEEIEQKEGQEAFQTFKLSLRDATPAALAAQCQSKFPTLADIAVADDDLLFLNDVYRRAGLNEEALHFLARLEGPGRDSGVFHEKKGFTLLPLKRLDEALDCFRQGTERFPEWPYNWLGVVIAASRSGLPIEQYEDAITKFFSFDVPVYGDSDSILTLAKKVANRLYERGMRQAAMPILLRLEQQGRASDVERIRLIELFVQRNEVQKAAKVAAGLERSITELNPWLRTSLANFYSVAGEYAKALEALAFIWLERRVGVHQLHTLVTVLHRAGMLRDQVPAVEMVARKLSRNGRAAIELLVALRQGELASAFEILKANTSSAFNDLPHVVMELGYAMLARSDGDSATVCLEYLRNLPVDKAQTAKLEANVLFLRQDWEKAEELLSAVVGPDCTDEDLLLKRFELYCFQNRLDQARGLLDRLMSAARKRPAFLPALMRYFSEMKEWNAVLELVTPEFWDGFGYAQTGDVILRAYERAGRLLELEAALAERMGRNPSDDMRRLWATVTEMQAWEANGIELALEDESIRLFPMLVRRLEIKKRLLGSSPTLDVESVDVFYCADKAYSLAAAVSLSSLLRHNPELRRQARFHVVMDDHDPDAVKIFTVLGERLGADVRVQDAAQVLEGVSSLNPAYGVFTSGEQLAASAYYRIFFARKLAREQCSGRALYIDADTVIRGNLQKLVTLDLGGKPLGARREAVKPEVLNAERLHDLGPGEYFNSGVLLFDFGAPSCLPALDKSIAAALSPDVKLMFHDQCALNLGFRGQVHYLPEAFNHFVLRKSEPGDLPQGDAVLHFLDRPKPWKAAYEGPCSALWLEDLESLAQIVGRDLCLELFKAA